MNILLTHPFCRPHVRRGGERILEELAAYLAGRGHDVTVLTSVPASDAGELRRGGVHIVRSRQLGRPWLTRLGFPPETLFTWTCYRFLRRHRFDLVACLHHADGVGVRLASRRSGTPYLLHIMGIPVGRWVRRRPWDTLITRLAIGGAARVVVLSDCAGRALRDDFGRGGVVVSAPCDLDAFTPREGRDLASPRILAAGAFGERRKGGHVLMQAFSRVAARLPGAVLQVSGTVPGRTVRELLAIASPDARSRVRFLGAGDPAALPDLYRSAAVTVLPSVGEAFGMVLVESLACGTPVVGSRAGGIPEVIDPGVGVLFDPGPGRHRPSNPDGLAAAILEALALHRDPDIHRRCRASAERFGWPRIGAQLERLYLESGQAAS